MNRPDFTPLLFADLTASYVFTAVAVFAIAVVAFLLFLILFEPKLRYRITAPPPPPDAEAFLPLLAALTDAQAHPNSRVEVLTDGPLFYEAELAAVRDARASVNLEAYIFEPGDLTGRFLEALAERARAGVKVNLVVDAVGSSSTRDRYFEGLRGAGGRVYWYHPPRWYNFKRFNNRTHRNLLLVDGRAGFLGGAGFADRWAHGTDADPRWRDTMFRVEGELVPSLQSTFAENWLESSEEILLGDEFFPPEETEGGPVRGGTTGLVVNSEPSAGRATRARILFQVLLAAARVSIDITTPYFLPDRSVRAELIRAARERGVRVTVVTTGDHCDSRLPRRLSRSVYGELLKAGVTIYEYQPSMIHTKSMVIDGLWSVVGSTNFDHRSFGHNDEVNLAAADRELAARLLEDFARDQARGRAISYEEWLRRPLSERLQEKLFWVLKRQA